MRWFSTEEICDILGRFEKVIILGDSMMRHVVGSINVLIRKDLGYGAVTDWNFSPEERYDCLCLMKPRIRVSTNMAAGKIASATTNSTLKPAPFKAFSKPPTLSRMILRV